MPIEFDGPNSKVSANAIEAQSGSTITIQSGHNLSGGGSGLTGLNATQLTSGTLPMARLSGTLPALNGSALTNLPSTPIRNFIIDGDFTQWPGGTSATNIGNNTYVSALMQGYVGNTSGTMTVERSTDVPTVAQSGHQSSYSCLAKCTGADTSLTGTDLGLYRFNVTGSDFAHLHQQQVTVSFWAKTASANSGDTYALHLHNSAFNRSYVHEFTPTSSWTRFTHTLTLDTSGTWLFTETGIGLVIGITLVGGTDYDDATNDTWTGTLEFGTSNQDNFYDSTSNEFYISQFGLYLGSSAPNFTSPAISTVRDQVDYYVQRFDFEIDSEQICVGQVTASSNSQAKAEFRWHRKMRATPSVTTSATATFALGNNISDFSAAGFLQVAQPSDLGFRFILRRGIGGCTQGDAAIFARDGTDTTWIMADARH